MTISASAGYELTIDKLVRRAYQIAGLMPAEQGMAGQTWNARADLGRDLLGTILDEIQTDGAFRRSVSFTTVTLTAGTYIYTLPATVFDVLGDGAYISAAETDLTKANAETPVIQKDRETWQRMSAKSATGIPTMFFVDPSVFPVQVYFWLIPREAGHVRLQTYRLLANVTQGANTIDIERYWHQFLIWELAHQLASAHSQSEEKCMRLAATAQQKRERARAYANAHVPNQMFIDHPTPWSGR